MPETPVSLFSSHSFICPKWQVCLPDSGSKENNHKIESLDATLCPECVPSRFGFQLQIKYIAEYRLSWLPFNRIPLSLSPVACISMFCTLISALLFESIFHGSVSL